MSPGFVRNSGFSLIELIIVTAMLAILLTLAAPSYREFSLRSHRTVAISRLVTIASCQERIRATAGFYHTGVCLPVSDTHYRYNYEHPGIGSTTTYMATATPIHAQLKDRCGAMSLDQDGRRAIGNNTAETGRCWAGR